MTNKSKPNSSNNLKQLFASHLKQQILLFEQGISAPSFADTAIPLSTIADVTIDAVQAWKEAIFTTENLGKNAKVSLPSPPGWQSLIGSLSPFYSMPFASGHFPQAVRNPFEIPKLLQEEKDWAKLLPLPELDSWSKESLQRKLISLGICRLAAQFDQATTLLNSIKNELPEPLFFNEQGANLWALGNRNQAMHFWNQLNDEPFACFNRGLGLLTQGETKLAVQQLQKASGQIPESSGWHHLAMLYQNSF